MTTKEYVEINSFCWPVEGEVSEESFVMIGQYGRRMRCQSVYLSFKDSQDLMKIGGEGCNYFRLSPNEKWRSKSDFLSSLNENVIQEREISPLEPPESRYQDTKGWYPESGYSPSW